MDAAVKAYDYFNERLFAARLPPAIVRFQPEHMMPGSVMVRRFGGGKPDELWINKDRAPTKTDMYLLSCLVHEMVHMLTKRPGDGHDAVWVAEMKRIGLDARIWHDEEGRQSDQSPVPGGAFDVAAREFLNQTTPSRVGPSRRFGPGEIGDCQHMIAADCSWSMNARFDAKRRRIDALKEAVGSVWPKISNNGIIFGYAGGIVQVHGPNELSFELGITEGTWFSPALKIALERNVGHLHLFSDGMLESNDKDRAFEYRNRGKFAVSTYLIIEDGAEYADASMIEYAERTMIALARGHGGYTRIRTMSDLTSSIQKNIGITGAGRMATTPLSRVRDYSADVQGALEVVATRIGLNKEIVEVAGRVNDHARRLGALERNNLIGSAMTGMLEQADASAEQTLRIIGSQYRADEADSLASSDKLRTVLEGAGGEVARLTQQCFGGLLVNQATAAAQAPDRSAPVKLEVLPLDAGVLAQVQALYAAHLPAQSLPASATPLPIEDRRRMEPVHAPALAAPIPQQGSATTGSAVTPWRPALRRRG